MQYISVLIAIVVGLILIVIFVLIYFKLNSLTKSNESTALQMLQNQINALASTIDQRLESNSRQISEQFLNSYNSSTKLIQEISKENNELVRRLTEKISDINNTNRQIIDFAGKLQEIQNIFKNPKQRGIIGEYFLETILNNVLPETVYKMQYKFPDGNTVDAVIFFDDKIIPIDSKFSVDNYTKMIEETDNSQKNNHKKDFENDIKKRIDETAKYVKIEENTVGIALMFIPSDAIYNEIISLSYTEFTTNLINYAYSKKVILVSPTSLFAYLQTVLLALNTLKVSKNLDEIVEYLNESTHYLRKFEESINRVGKNINALVNSYNQASIDAQQLSKRIAKISNNKENLIIVNKVQKEESVLGL